MPAMDFDQVSQIARLAVLAMCARGVLESECEGDSDIQGFRLVVNHQKDSPASVDAEFLGVGGMPIGGMAL